MKNKGIRLSPDLVPIAHFLINGKLLFSDTEVFENVPQNFVAADLAGDCTKILQAFADVLGKEFTRELYGFFAPGHTLISRTVSFW